MDLLDIQNIKKYFKQPWGINYALDGVDMSIKEKATTALVGESGCGKTTLAKTILGFYRPDSGKILFKGEDITDVKTNNKLVRENIQIVFQNPFLSFNPRYTAFATLYEAVRAMNNISKKEVRGFLVESLNSVGLGEEFFFRYPHQMSGGELQRLSIARALINKPKIVILDEPTSSLDISTAVNILKLLAKLQQEALLSYFFISHNLKLVKRIAHYVFVMYYGKIVEYGLKEQIYGFPRHPYTKLLLDACEYKMKDYPASGSKHKQGCVFREICPHSKDICGNEPEKTEIEPNHFVFCHFV